MRVLFTAIRKGDTEKIVALITKKPELVNCIAKQPPKMDDGKSPLQVALSNKNFVAAKYLLENGADVNFIDSTSVNEWQMPVLHDAIMAAVSEARFEFPVNPWDEAKKDLYKLEGIKEHFNVVYAILKIIVDNGADANSVDSFGNTALMRACLDAENKWSNKERPLAKETIQDIRQIFDLLISAGANIHQSTPTREAITKMNKNLLEQLKIVI